MDIEGNAFQRLSVKGLGVSGELGDPELPAWRRLVEVPQNATMVTVEVQEEKGALLGLEKAASVPVYPVQLPMEKIPGAKPSPLVWNKSLYAAKSGLRPSPVEVAPFGRLRGRMLYQVTVYPVDYQPASGELTARTHLQFAIRWTSGKTAPAWQDARYRTAWSDMADQDMLLNPQQAGEKSYTAFPAAYLIVAAPQFAGDPNLARLVEWKRARGFETTLVSTETTGSTAEEIKAYVADAYTNWEIPPTFLLLVGDTDTIPHWTGSGAGSPATDLNYATVDGPEYNTPDLWYGRLSATTAGQLANAVNKTLAYEQGLWESTADWETYAAFMAGVDHSSVTEGTHNAVIDTYSAPAGFENDRLYVQTYSATTAQVRAALNAGRGMMVYSGHGSEVSWADGPIFLQSNVNASTNTVYPFVLSFACITGAYHVAECFGETWLRASSGGVCFFGASENSYWTEDDILERVMFDQFFGAGVTWTGGLMDFAMTAYHLHFGESSTTRRYREMYNLMGDPSLDLFTEPVQDFTVNHLPTVRAGFPAFQVSVDQDGAVVSITQNGLSCGVAVSSGGVAVVPLSPPLVSGEAILTVSGHNHRPYQVVLPVAAGSDGAVALDRRVYGAPADVGILMSDADLAALEGYDVALSAANGDSETLTLTRGSTGGLFSGSIQTIAGTGGFVADDGLLQVQDGDTITVTYEDMDIGDGTSAIKSDQSSVDLRPPLISGVTLTSITTHSARVTFVTDEPAISEMECGRTCEEPFPFTAQSTSYVTSQTFTVDGLADSTEYHFILTAEDPAGNVGISDCFSFETPNQTDYFTEIFSASENDLDYLRLEFTPNGSGDYYGACLEPATEFPIGVSGASPLSLGDDSSQAVTLENGKTVSLYGVSYSQYYVGSNGYVTFTRGDSSYSENLADHFKIPRISGLFDDLNPSVGGAIYRQQLDDQAVVTFDRIPHYSGGGTVSFQIQMFFDGRIAITWLQIGIAGGLAGLSEGTGSPVDFVNSDLSAYSPCAIEGEGAAEGEGIAEGEGTVEGEGTPEGEGAIEGAAEGEGILEGEAPAVWLDLTRETAPVPFRYVAGETLEVILTWQMQTSKALTTLTLQEQLPPGWLFVGPVGAEWYPAGDWQGPDPGASGLIEFTLMNPEAPAEFRYEVQVPADATGQYVLLGSAQYSLDGETASTPPVITPLYPVDGEYVHNLDADGNFEFSLSELLRAIQLFNTGGYHCDPRSEDGYGPGLGDTSCTPLDCDYAPQNWKLNLVELLRVIQFYNSHGYHVCATGEDGFCPGLMR
jgi:hypothetical protein